MILARTSIEKFKVFLNDNLLLLFLGIAGLVLLCLLVIHRRDLGKIFAIFTRELKAMFASPIAYVVLFVFMFLIGLIGASYLERMSGIGIKTTDIYTHLTNPQNLGLVFFYLSVTIPLMTMRLFSEEYSSGCYEVLATDPVGEWSAALGKFFAGYAMYLILWSWTIVYTLISYKYSQGNPDYGKIMGFYLGVSLVGLLFVSAGLFASSLARDQIVSGLIGVMFCLGLWLLPLIFQSFSRDNFLKENFNSIDILSALQNCARGKLASNFVILCLSASFFFVLLTVQAAKSRRWR